MNDQPSLADQPHRVSITSNGLAARILLNNTDITAHVTGYTIQQQPGAAPLVVLQTRPSDGVVFEGLAHVAVATEPDTDPGDMIAAFLKNIDPDALAAAALERDDLDGSRNELTKAMLAQLADWAQGRT